MMPYSPMLCTPQLERYLKEFNDDWIAEVKYDGERIIAERRKSAVHLYTRRELDVTLRFPEVVSALEAELPKTDWVIDGELTVESGFDALLRRNTDDQIAIRVYSKNIPARLNVFDILKLGDKRMVRSDDNTQKIRLSQRREILDGFLPLGNNTVVRAHSVRGTRARNLFDMVTSDDGEGVVVKRLDSLYEPGRRSPYWFKIKKYEDVDVTVVGATKSDAYAFGALVLVKDGKYYGKVGTGFTEKQRNEIMYYLMNHPDQQDFGRWNIPPNVKREMIRVCAPLRAVIKMLEENKKGNPRHPVWVRWGE